MTTEEFFDQSMNKSFQEEIEFTAFINGMKSVLQTNNFARGINLGSTSSGQYRDMLVLDLESRDFTLLICDGTQENKYMMAQLNLSVHNLIQVHFKEGIQLGQPEMTGYCKYFSAALNAADLRASMGPFDAYGSVIRLHLEYNVGGNIESGFLDLPIIQTKLEPEIFTLIRSISRASTWHASNLTPPNLLYDRNSLPLVPPHLNAHAVPVNTAPTIIESTLRKQQVTSKVKSSGKPYKKTAGGTSIFVGGGNHFYGIGTKKSKPFPGNLPDNNSSG